MRFAHTRAAELRTRGVALSPVLNDTRLVGPVGPDSLKRWVTAPVRYCKTRFPCTASLAFRVLRVPNAYARTAGFVQSYLAPFWEQRIDQMFRSQARPCRELPRAQETVAASATMSTRAEKGTLNHHTSAPLLKGITSAVPPTVSASIRCTPSLRKGGSDFFKTLHKKGRDTIVAPR